MKSEIETKMIITTDPFGNPTPTQKYIRSAARIKKLEIAFQKKLDKKNSLRR